jgi:hypothetical protein
MGVEFTQTTPEHRANLAKFLGILTDNRDLTPELLVDPEGLETESVQPADTVLEGPEHAEPEDTLIALFRNQGGLSADSFLTELRKQRGAVVAGVSA